MGRESHDPSVVNSSIALLQERFRQLQRVKEMREERELMKMHTAPKQQFNSNIPTVTYDYESTRLFSHPELIVPSRSPPHVSLSLWPTSQSSVQTPVSMNLCPTDYTHTQSMQASWKKNVYDWDSGSDSGVDTSLHL